MIRLWGCCVQLPLACIMDAWRRTSTEVTKGQHPISTKTLRSALEGGIGVRLPDPTREPGF